MSDVTTWVVLSDGRYIKILINKGTGKQLFILDADDLPAYAELCYLMVNNKPLNGTGDLAVSKAINNLQYQADFLVEHHKLGMFNRLVIVAPPDVLSGLKVALPEQLVKLIDGELAEDLTVTSNDVIQNRIEDMIATAA
jgi:hypothetical protein